MIQWMINGKAKRQRHHLIEIFGIPVLNHRETPAPSIKSGETTYTLIHPECL